MIFHNAVFPDGIIQGTDTFFLYDAAKLNLPVRQFQENAAAFDRFIRVIIRVLVQQPAGEFKPQCIVRIVARMQ